MFPKDNPESWQRIHEFIDEFPDTPHWSQWKPLVRSVISDLESRGLSTLFRVGQSMHHILFSLVEHHRLVSEPHVTLEFHAEPQTVRVAYGYTNLHFGEPAAEEVVPVASAIPSILAFLRRLWGEARPGISVPDALTVA